MRVSRVGRVGLVAALVGAVACGSDSTGPRGQVSNIVFVAGNHQTDTIQATLSQALVVRIGNVPPGQSASHQIVQFVALVDSSRFDYEAYVEPLSSQQPQTFVADSTDLSGETGVVVVLGARSGGARIVVKIPAFGYVDTAVFTVTAGNPRAIVTSPRDSTVTVGGTVTLKTAVTDRLGNPRTDPVTLRVGSGPATISGTIVTGTDVGRVQIVGSAGSFTDTTFLTIVPHGTLAATTFNNIAVFHLDGSGLTTITPSVLPVGNLKWAPSGRALVYDQSNVCNAQRQSILTTDLTGKTTVVDANGSIFDQYATYSRDGTWIYYSQNTGGSSTNWRAHTDGTANDSLQSLAPGFDIFPSPSTDGSKVAYVGIDNAGWTLRVLTVATGAVTNLGLAAWSPEWSPVSDQIAYIGAANCYGPIAIVHADGSGSRVLAVGPYASSFDWSPDGQWIAAKNASTNLIDIINVTTGVALPLPYTSSMFAPTWLPTSN